MTEIANKELEKTTVDEKAVPETAAGGIKIDKDGSVLLPTAAEEWDAAVERSKAKKIENELEDTSSIEPEKPVSEYPYDEKEVLEDYAEYRNPQINSFVSGVLDGTGNTKMLYLDDVSDSAADDIQRITGVDAHGFRTGLENRMVEHINKDHGPDGKADQSMANIEDWERIQYVLNNYDSIEFGGTSSAYTTIKNNGYPANAKTVVYSKAINGTFYVVEAVPDTNAKTVNIVSAYISKKKGGSSSRNAVTDTFQRNVINGYSQAETSETPSTHTLSNDSISQNNPGVKIEKDGSIMLPTAEGEINAAAANKKDILPGFSDVTTETTEMTGRACGVSEENIGIAVRLSHALGVKVAFYEDLNSDERGQYFSKTGVIWVNSKYQDVFSNVFGHELTHSIEKSKLYRKLAAFVEKRLKAEGKDINVLIKQKQESYARRGKMLSPDEARHEVIAKYVGEVLLNNEAVIADIARTDRGLGGFLLSKIDSLVAKITGKNKEAVYIRRVQQMFRKALEDVSRKEGAKVSDGSEQQRGSVYEDAGLNELAERFRNGDISQDEYLSAYNEYMEQNPGLEDEDFFEGRQFDLDDKYYDYAKNDFAKQIDDYLNPIEKLRKKPKNDSFLVGGTPKVLLDVGFNALPVTINKTHIDYALNGTKDFDHEVFIDVLKKIPEAIKSPIIVMENDSTTGRVVVVLKITAKNGKKLYMPIEIDGTAKNNGIRIDSNAIVSLFGKGNVEDKIEKALNREAQGNTSVFYWNKKEAISLLQRGGSQLPTRLPQDGFVHSIREKGSNVKVKLQDVTESLQFKKWFGDWQKRPKKASKVVNDDGTPKVVYHGSYAGFTVFGDGNKTSKAPAGTHFFTDDENVAYSYTGYKKKVDFSKADSGEWYSGGIYPVYLDIKNPYVVDFNGETWNSKTAVGMDVNEIAQYAKDNGYDGVIIKNVIDAGDGGDVNWNVENTMKSATDYIVFDSTQVKSATDNIGTFDKNNPDIRYDFDDANDYSSATSVATAENAEKKPAKSTRRTRKADTRKATEDRLFNKRELERLAKIKSELEDADELTVEQVTALWGEMRKLQRNVTAMSMAHQITNEELTQVTDLLRGDRTFEDVENLNPERCRII